MKLPESQLIEIKNYLYTEFNLLFKQIGKKSPAKKYFFENITYVPAQDKVYLKNEIDIFRKLFILNNNNVLYHYTSLESLLYIIKSGKLKFSGVAGFNDANELRSKSTILGEGLKNPYNKDRMNLINNRFVFCLSKRKDDLNQWRLYGSDGKGISLGFKLRQNEFNVKGKYAGEVHYGDTIRTFLNEKDKYVKSQWNVNLQINHSSKWGYFIKGNEWKDEEEVRIVRIFKDINKKCNIDSWDINSHGILFPSILVNLSESGLELSSITLGPKCPVPELNKAQINILLKNHFNLWKSTPIKMSKIKSYR